MPVYKRVVRFEWDEIKHQANIRKHGVSFPDAVQVFADNVRVEYEDTRRNYGETRFLVVAEIDESVFVVVYTWRDDVCRIISARRANDRETKRYYTVRAGSK